MYGRITKFREDLGVGVITTPEGKAFRFANSEIVNSNGKLVGLDVDFLIDQRQPREIFLMDGTPWSAFGAPGAH